MISNSDLQRWQQATKGMGASQNALTQEELSAFQALTEFINSSNFEASESEGYIQVLKNAMLQHANNRILKAHLTNFVTLCEKYFNVPVVNPPPIIQISAEITPPQVNKPSAEITLPQAPKTKPKTEKKGEKTSGVSKKTMIIIGSALVVLVILAIGGYFIFKGGNLFSGSTGGNLFSGSTDGETIDYSLIPVSSNGEKWGYIDQKGAYVINPQFDHVDFFVDGLAKVTSGGYYGENGYYDGKTNYINKKGEYVIAANYKDGTAFSGGLAFVVENGGPPTCIDKNGNTKFVLKDAEYVFAFSEGLALFIISEVGQNGYIVGGKYGFVDRNGNIAIQAQFERAMPFCGGFAIILQDGKYGFIDKNGRIVINPQFEKVGNFSEGMAAFYDGRQWGYINTKGAYAINPQFDYAGPFSQGMALVKQGEKYGYINKEGRLVINPQFDYASSFSDGLAVIGNKEGSGSGYISKDGQIKINPQFGYAENFYNGIAPVYSAFKWGFINKSGQYVVNPQFSSIKSEIPKEYKTFEFGEINYNSESGILLGYAGIFNNFDFVQSNYYDASEFVKLFFERESGNTFDGVTTSTTLEELSNHPKYGSGLNARQSNYADYNQEIPITKDITIRSVAFRFDSNPIYRIIEEIYNDRGRIIDTRKEYDFTATPDAIVYEFSNYYKADKKCSAVVSALKAEIERRHGQTMKKMNMASGQEVYCLFQENGKLSFAIIDIKWAFIFHVAFNREYLSKQFQESSQE